MNARRLALLLTLAALATALGLAWLWQPERQVRRHTASLLKAAGARDWAKFDHFLAADYADRWGHDKAFVTGGAKEIFQQFILVDLEHEIISVAMNGLSARVQARVKIRGQGGAGAQFVMTTVNGLADPFVFTWNKSGAKPWEWELVSLDQPALELDGNLGIADR